MPSLIKTIAALSLVRGLWVSIREIDRSPVVLRRCNDLERLTLDVRDLYNDTTARDDAFIVAFLERFRSAYLAQPKAGEAVVGVGLALMTDLSEAVKGSRRTAMLRVVDALERLSSVYDRKGMNHVAYE